jgi:hypothetical protein
MRKSLLLLALCLAPQVTPAAIAQGLRFLPPGEQGRTGENLPMPDVKIDKRVLRLAPGGVIFDQNNRTLLQQNLPVDADVLYTRDLAGDLQRIYILTAEEKARLAANPPAKPVPVPGTAQTVNPAQR